MTITQLLRDKPRHLYLAAGVILLGFIIPFIWPLYYHFFFKEQILRSDGGHLAANYLSRDPDLSPKSFDIVATSETHGQFEERYYKWNGEFMKITFDNGKITNVEQQNFSAPFLLLLPFAAGGILAVSMISRLFRNSHLSAAGIIKYPIIRTEAALRFYGIILIISFILNLLIFFRSPPAHFP